MSKLEKLTEDFGFSEAYDMLDAYMPEGVMPAICMNDGCDYSTEYEPDQDAGWCECCETNTVMSAALLAGII